MGQKILNEIGVSREDIETALVTYLAVNDKLTEENLEAVKNFTFDASYGHINYKPLKNSQLIEVDVQLDSETLSITILEGKIINVEHITDSILDKLDVVNDKVKDEYNLRQFIDALIENRDIDLEEDNSYLEFLSNHFPDTKIVDFIALIKLFSYFEYGDYDIEEILEEEKTFENLAEEIESAQIFKVFIDEDVYTLASFESELEAEHGAGFVFKNGEFLTIVGSDVMYFADERYTQELDEHDFLEDLLDQIESQEAEDLDPEDEDDLYYIQFRDYISERPFKKTINNLLANSK